MNRATTRFRMMLKYNHGMNTKMFCEAAGVSRSEVLDIVNGRRQATIQTRRKIIAVIGAEDAKVIFVL